MGTADLFLALSLALLVCVPPATVLPLLVRRAGWADPAVRRIVWTGVAVAVVLLAAQAAVVIAVETAGGHTVLDESVLTWIVAHRNPWATGLAIVLAALGGTAAMTVLAATAVLVQLYLGHWQRGLLVAATSAGAGLLVLGFKQLYTRQRPPGPDQVIHYSGHSLPSGHALGSIVVLGVVSAVLVPTLLGAARAWTVLGAVAMVALVGWCRVYLGAHWVTDVLTGWLLGGAWLALALTALALWDRVSGSARSAGAAAQVPDQHTIPRPPRPE